MSQTIPAVFDAGVFRPLQPVNLADGTRVDVQVTTSPCGERAAELSPEQLAQQQKAIVQFLSDMEALPLEGPDDGFSGRDHDKVLYGKP